MKEVIFSKPKIETVQVPEWGTVHIRVMTARQREQWESIVRSEKPLIRASLVCYCLCDPNGVRVFKDDELEQVADADANALQVVYEACLALNKLLPDSKKD